MLMQRRSFLALLGAGLSSSVLPTPAWGRPITASAGFDTLDLKLAGDASVARRALVLVPKSFDPAARHPAVVLLHGYGQASSETAAIHAWRDDYGALRNVFRLENPPIERMYNTVRYLDDRRIRELDQSLERQPYEGLVLICPVVPIPYFTHDAGHLLDEYASWIRDVLLPGARAHAPISDDPAQIGLAGHSMGGHVALEVFLRQPELFGALSAVQPELQRNAGARYAKRLANRMQQAGARPLQLLTSTRDPYRHEVRLLHEELARQSVTHTMRSCFGPHASSWMREIGTLETLLFQDHALHHGIPAPGQPGKPGDRAAEQRVAGVVPAAQRGKQV
jgi:predicted esterase